MISAVIPAFNEEAAIDDTVSRLKAVFEQAGYQDAEIVIVDDCSTDETAALATKLGCKVISHLNNLGYGRSLKDGIKAAEHDTIVTLDADGTYPIEDIPKLVAEYQKGFDMVIGQRTGKHYHESWFKMPLRRLLKFLVEFSAGRKIADVNSGMRVFSKKTIRRYFKQLSDSFSFSTSTTLAYLMTGKCISFMPIEYFERVGKSKVRLFRDSLRTMQYITQAILYYNPIKIFILFCCLVMAMGGLFLLIAVLTKSVGAFLLLIGCILLSILIFSIGLVADLLRQILITSGPDRKS